MSIALPRRGARALLALMTAAALLAPAATVNAASFTFSDAKISSTFNKGIDFSIRLSASEAPARAEIQINLPGATGPFVVDLADSSCAGPSAGPCWQPAAGTATLHYTLDTSADGHLMPNTPLLASWVVYPQGGGDPVRSDATGYRYTDETQAWQTLRDGIVTVHWTQGPESFAQRAAGVAAKAITTDAALLGVSETQPVDFFIYADDASFRAALGPGTRENVGGEAITEIRTLFAELTPNILNDPWVSIVITHELTHQVIDDATRNPYRSLPRWLNEGVAVYQSEGDGSGYQGMVHDAVASGDLLPLTALGWQFPTDPQKTSLGYAESVSAVDYLIRTYGKPALVKLVLAYKNGPTDDEALTAAIGKNLADFQAAWYQSIGAKPPSQFGPRPAPSGPLPPGWSAAQASGAPSSPGASPTAGGTAAGASPTATAGAGSGSGQNGSAGDDLPLVLVALMLLAGTVLVGIVVAGRRASSP